MTTVSQEAEIAALLMNYGIKPVPAALVKELARHRQSAERGEVVGYIIPEMLNRKSEFEANGIVLHSRPSGMATMPLYTLPTPPETVRTPIEGTSHD